MMLVAVGHYPDAVPYAISPRKALNEVLIPEEAIWPTRTTARTRLPSAARPHTVGAPLSPLRCPAAATPPRADGSCSTPDGCGCVLLVPPCEIESGAHSIGDAATVLAAAHAIERSCASRNASLSLTVAHFGATLGVAVPGASVITFDEALRTAHRFRRIVITGTDVSDGRYGMGVPCRFRQLALAGGPARMHIVSISFDESHRGEAVVMISA